MTRALWIDPSFGASGDMLLGALAGVLTARRARDDASGSPKDVDDVLAPLERLGLETFELRLETVQRCGLSCHRMLVDVTDADAHRAWSSIDALIAGASLPSRAAEGARSTFRALGEIEAAQHGVDIDEVHFHEVGAADSILDIVGTWLLVDALDPAEIVVGPVGLGHGTVKAAHGLLPLPAPATMALLSGAPTRPLDHEGETCTPTGAALLTTLADRWGPMPAGAIVDAQRGAGGRDPASHPNAVTIAEVDVAVAQAITDTTPTAAWSDEASVVIECNVDDTTAEVLAATVDRLLAEGAQDAWLTPIVMKKGRLATKVSVLCDPTDQPHLVAVLMAETGSLGCRSFAATKHVLPRRIEHVTVRGQRIAVKVGPHTAKPEHDDLVAAAAITDLPVRQLDLEARAAWNAVDADQSPATQT